MSCDLGEYEKERFILSTCCLLLVKRILRLCEEKMIDLWKNRKQIMAVLCFESCEAI